jgi:hypothetical protein
MATKRTPLTRSARTIITPEAVELFRFVMARRARYISCIQGEPCDSTDLAAHCESCRAQIDASVRLRSALAVPLWGTAPYDAADPVPPAWLEDPRRRDQYDEAHSLYLALSEAAG